MKILVNSPTGVQELIEIGEGGGYFDPSLIIWDERADGPLPNITLGGMIRSGNNLVYSQTRMDATIAAQTALTPPLVVSPRQIRQALTAAGVRASVEVGVTAADQDTRDWWEFATSFEENHPMVLTMAAGLGITDTQRHDIFVLAASL